MSVNGYDDEFDYAGSGCVAPVPGLRGMGGRLPRDYIGQPLGTTDLSADISGVVKGLEARAAAPSGIGRAMGVWRKMGDARVRMGVSGLYLRQNRATRELVAYVASNVWLFEFQMRAPAYLQEWNHLCEVEGLDMRADKLTFRVGRAAAPGPRGIAFSGPGAAGGAADGTAGAPASDSAGAPRPARAGIIPRGRLTAQEEETIGASVAVIEDETVRQKAYSAMKAVLEREKWEKSTTRKNGA